MDQRDGSLVFSPSDLTAFTECEHLTALQLARARGNLVYTPPENVQRELVVAKGDEHERAYLDALRAEGKDVAEIELGEDRWNLDQAARVAGQALALYEAKGNVASAERARSVLEKLRAASPR